MIILKNQGGTMNQSNKTKRYQQAIITWLKLLIQG